MKFRITEAIKNKAAKVGAIAGFKGRKIVGKIEVWVEWIAPKEHFEFYLLKDGEKVVLTQGIFSDTFYLNPSYSETSSGRPALFAHIKKVPDGIDKVNNHAHGFELEAMPTAAMISYSLNPAVCRLRIA